MRTINRLILSASAAAMAISVVPAPAIAQSTAPATPQRMQAPTVILVHASHVSLLSHPKEFAAVIEQAVAATAPGDAK